jgi:hypothetical protein
VLGANVTGATPPEKVARERFLLSWGRMLSRGKPQFWWRALVEEVRTETREPTPVAQWFGADRLPHDAGSAPPCRPVIDTSQNEVSVVADEGPHHVIRHHLVGLDVGARTAR